MTDEQPQGVQIVADVGGVKLAISVRVVGGEITGVRGPGGDHVREPAAPAREARPSQERAYQGGGGGGGRKESIIPEINRLRERHGLEGGRGTNLIAEAMGSRQARVVDIEDWLAEDPDRTLEELMLKAANMGKSQRGGGRR